MQGVVDEGDANAIVACTALRIRELLTEVLSGYFYVSAIRKMHPYSHLDEIDPPFDSQNVIDSRYVGPQGEATWWLERQFAHNPMEPTLDTRPNDLAGNDPSLEEYTSKWMRTLLQTEIKHSQVDYSAWSGSPPEDSPTGFLIDARPLADENEFDRILEKGSLARLLHRCFEDEPQSPKQMSSGFHQLMPLIVQTGLMRQHEIMAVENPEVHLHPKLQLDVAEFLMRQAHSGKWMMIETHSDLIIRRVIRGKFRKNRSRLDRVRSAFISRISASLRKATIIQRYTLGSMPKIGSSGRKDFWEMTSTPKRGNYST